MEMFGERSGFLKINSCGVSVQGFSHILREKPCQDYFRSTYQVVDGKKKNRGYNTETDKRYLFAVADGHGSESCPYSAKGAEFATKVFTDALMRILVQFGTDEAGLLSFLHREGSVSLAKTIDYQWKNKVRKYHFSKYHGITDESEIDIYHKYGTTLLGLLVSKEFVFAFQLGDGDIMRIDRFGVSHVLEQEHILGTETHSLCRTDAWEKVISCIQHIEDSQLPCLYMMSTDGLSNSYKTETDFFITCKDYYDIIDDSGFKAVKESLPEWLNDTSKNGCGDDTTLVLVYIQAD